MNRTNKEHRSDARLLEMAILLALPILFHYLIPVMIVIPMPYTYPGIVIMFVGLAFGTWAATLFRKAGTSFQLKDESPVLVTAGPFRISRNPMYLGMLLWLVGLVVLLGSLIAFLFPFLFLVLANWIIPLEEKRMEHAFGEPYIEYKRHVRRWL